MGTGQQQTGRKRLIREEAVAPRDQQVEGKLYSPPVNRPIWVTLETRNSTETVDRDGVILLDWKGWDVGGGGVYMFVVYS